VQDASLEIVEYFGQRAEKYAKANRRWTDRTGQAREGLTATAEKREDGAVYVLAHTVEHGVPLELDHGRKYAIIEEAIRATFSPQLMGKMMQRLFGGAAKGIVSVTGKVPKNET
jgi:fructose/tagatose bisphosphate aldolase